MSQLPSFLRKGAPAPAPKRDNPYLSIKDGEMYDIVPLIKADDVISYEQHQIWLDEGNSPMFPCLRSKDCPGCMIGNQPRFRALMPVLVRDKEGNVVGQRILSMGIDLYRQVMEIDNTIAGIMGKIIRVTRRGKALTTKYTAIPTGQAIKKPITPEIDVLEHLGPMTREEQIEVLETAGKWHPKGVAKGNSDATTEPPFDTTTSDWDAGNFEDPSDA